MSSLERILKPAFWALYAIIVFEILFMISPFALYFYSVYGPALRFFDQWAGTAWLTQFFLPHISETRSPLLNLLHPIVLVQVDISALEVTGMETPPPHVVWGDIPTPLF